MKITSSRAKHERWTEEAVMRQLARMKIMKRMTKRNRAKGMINAQELWWVIEMLANGDEKRGSTQKQKTRCRSGMHGKKQKTKDEDQ